MISYFGGKANMVDWINIYIPRNIKKYAEPFSGAFWTYINIKYQFPELDKIVYNDWNGHMANLYACMTQPKVFAKKLEEALSAGGFLYTDKKDKDDIRNFYKEIYYKYKHDKSEGNFLDNPPSNFPDFDAGVIYSFLITSAFNGCYPRSAGCSPISTNLKPKVTALLNKLKDERYIQKLSKITDVHNEDFEEIFKKYDSSDTFFYVDPPYFSPNEDGADTAKRASWYGTKDFNYESHMRILNILKNTKGRWALSYYYFKELEDLLPRDKYTWIQKDFYRSSASFAEGEQTKGTELLIMNYKLTDEEIEYNKKFLNSTKKPTTKTTMTKKTEIEKPSEQLLDELIVEIKKDLNSGDLQSLYELLSFLPINNIKNYLPEVIEIVDDILITEDEESGDNIVVENSDDFWE
jgi:DNA adenine methylase